jgi:hypothetical protein
LGSWQLLTGNEEAEADDGVVWVEKLCSELMVPTLGAYGMGTKDFEVLCERAH